MPNAKMLDQTHPDFDLCHQERLWALYRGGAAMATHKLALLPQRQAEEPKAYSERVRHALYVNTAGPVVDTLIQWLFEEAVQVSPETLRPTLAPAPGSLSLTAALAEATRNAAIHRYGWVYVTQPEVRASNLAEQEASGGLQPIYRPLDPTSVLDWDLNPDGTVRWAITRELKHERSGPGGSRRWWVVWSWITAESVTTYRLPVDQDATPPAVGHSDADVAEYSTVPVSGGQCPLVALHLPEGLWAMERMHDPAIGHFRANHSKDWALERSAFALLVFKRRAYDEPLPPIGHSFAIPLTTEEDMRFEEPPGRAISALRQNTLDYEEAVLRVMRQMALSTSTAAQGGGHATGASKARDMDPMRIVLGAYRAQVAAATARLASLVTAMRGGAAVVPASKVDVTGMDAWKERTLAEFFQAAALAIDAMAMSDTLAREVAKTKARKLLEGQVSAATMAKIEQEIEEADPDLAMPLGAKSLGDDVAATLAGTGGKEPDKDRAKSAKEGERASGERGDLAK